MNYECGTCFYKQLREDGLDRTLSRLHSLKACSFPRQSSISKQPHTSLHHALLYVRWRADETLDVITLLLCHVHRGYGEKCLDATQVRQEGGTVKQYWTPHKEEKIVGWCHSFCNTNFRARRDHPTSTRLSFARPSYSYNKFKFTPASS